jgi:hypothetical protein
LKPYPNAGQWLGWYAIGNPGESAPVSPAVAQRRQYAPALRRRRRSAQDLSAGVA